MRIAVITFFQSQNNYGQLLQCYALQKVLRQLGHKPYLIRYGFHQKFFHWLKAENFFTNGGLRMTYQQFKKWLRSRKDTSERGFDTFRKEHLIKSLRCYNSLAELQQHPPKARCYITGSDQVWAQLLSIDDNKSFFLDFGPQNVKRIAYASSFAVNDYPSELKGELAEQLRRFDAVSVREQSGVRICKELGYEASLVLDPTLLLAAEQYKNLKKEPSISNYCFVYQVNVSSKEELYWDVFADYNRKKDFVTVATFANPIYDIDMEFLAGARYVNPSIELWLGYICNASYVLTSSFHGVAFSLLFHKPFVVCLRKEGLFAGNDRVITLLEMLNLSDRVMQDGKRAEDIIEKPIDWEKVDAVLSQKRNESLAFLNNSIGR